MNRSYNFQVDNGLFVAEYLVGKPYEEITIEDLKENITKISELVVDRREVMGTLARLTHNNSFLANSSVKCTNEVVESKLMQLLGAIGEDRECMMCGEKRVDVYAKLYDKNKEGKIEEKNLPYSALMYGLPSLDKFANRANNIQAVDVCGVCLFFAVLSFLNTQKVSYPFLYLSDSDEFMRETTEKLQVTAKKGEMLMESGGKKDKTENEGILQRQFLEELLSRTMATEEGFEGMNYIEMHSFQNAKNNYYNVDKMDKEMVKFLGRLKAQGLIREFGSLGLFWAARKGKNLYTYWARQVVTEMIIEDKRLRQSGDEKTKKSKKGKAEEVKMRYVEISDKLLEKIRGVSMRAEELDMVDRVVRCLMEVQGLEKLKTEIRGIKTKQDFKDFLLEYNNEIPLFDDLATFDKLVEQNFVYKDLILASLQIKAHKEGKETEGEEN